MTGKRSQHTLAACSAAGVASLVIYCRTCHPTITWWDSAQYSLAAVTLGITGPPGSLVLTVLGWIATRLPLGIQAAFALNLLATLLAAGTIALTARVACDLHRCVARDDPSRISKSVTAAIALGSLPLAFGPTLWTYAVMFTPYVLTATMTATIFLALVRWWRSDSVGTGALFIIAFLVGLDFSVHRTNTLLAPGILCWVLIRRPRTVTSIRAWTASAGGLLAGLSLHLLLIPIAARSPALNIGVPSSWSRFWDYVSLQHAGGGFLLNVVPRRSGFFDSQLRDVLSALGSSFAAIDGSLLVLGAVPLVLGGYGLVSMWRRDVRLAVALATLLISTVLATVVYFNIPERYFRPLHRHYLPCLVIFAAVSAYGAGALTAHMRRHGGRRGVALVGLTLGVMAAVPFGRVADNFAIRDRSRNTFAYDYASNLLGPLPRDAILLTGGDNDTFPLWYLQIVEGMRPDVTVVNIPLTNAGWYVERVLGGPGGVAFSRPAQELAGLGPVAWDTREIALPGPHGEETGAPADSVRFRVAPTAGPLLLVQDQVVLDMIRTNRWERPVLVATTVPPTSLPWLRDYLRLEGLALRVVPNRDSAPRIDAMRANLARFRYRGYADPTVHIDGTTRSMAQNLLAAFVTLAGAVRDAEGKEGCAEIIAEMKSSLPFDRLQPSEQMIAAAAGACDTR